MLQNVMRFEMYRNLPSAEKNVFCLMTMGLHMPKTSDATTFPPTKKLKMDARGKEIYTRTNNMTDDDAERLLGGAIILGALFYCAVILFGDRFTADEDVIKRTVGTASNVYGELGFVFNDFGEKRVEVRYDYSVYAYISKNSFMHIPFPDREQAIAKVGKVWCNDKTIPRYFLPKVYIRDIQTGQFLGEYGCPIFQI